YSALNEDFVEGYLNETDNLLFEDKSAEVLKAIGFEVELRPKPTAENVRTQIELLIHLDEEKICVLDAKNYRTKFTLSAGLASHMWAEYLPNYQGYAGKNIAAYGYITASDWAGERNLEKISEKAKVTLPGSVIQGAMISATALDRKSVV